jgi:hypothetical protein
VSDRETYERILDRVIPKICSACGQLQNVKLASIYWAWNLAGGRRVAWLQKLCVACFTAQVVPLAVASAQPVLICPACGISTVDDYDAVYATICMPGADKYQSEMPLCGPCAVTVRNSALQGAARLPDRQTDSSGAATGPRTDPTVSPWAELGILPR